MSIVESMLERPGDSEAYCTHQLKADARLRVCNDNVDEEESIEALLVGRREFGSH